MENNEVLPNPELPLVVTSNGLELKFIHQRDWMCESMFWNDLKVSLDRICDQVSLLSSADDYTRVFHDVLTAGVCPSEIRSKAWFSAACEEATKALATYWEIGLSKAKCLKKRTLDALRYLRRQLRPILLVLGRRSFAF